MDTGYGQYCPISRAIEVLGDRWTLLIVRDLLVGTTRFNDLARGLPRISRSLLSARLRKLEQAGVVEHVDQDYLLTDAGRQLEPIVFGLGDWGARWAFGPPRPNELDPELLLWWAHTRIDPGPLPEGRVVIAFSLREPTFLAWLMVDDTGVELCKADPGFDVDATVATTVHELAEVWLGRADLASSIHAGRIDLTGRRAVVRALPDALQLSPVADLVRDAGERSAQASSTSS